jgi:hypothetical protein
VSDRKRIDLGRNERNLEINLAALKRGGYGEEFEKVVYEDLEVKVWIF